MNQEQAPVAQSTDQARFKALVNASKRCAALGQTEDALTNVDAAIELAQSIDRHMLATLYATRGTIAFQANLLVAAVGSLQRALSLAREFDMVDLEFLVLSTLAEAHHKLEQPEAALSVTESRLELAEKLAVPLEVVAAYADCADTLSRLGHYDRALTEYREARKILSSEEPIPLEAIQPIDDGIQDVQRRLGVELLRELPRRLAKSATVMHSNAEAPPDSSWPVLAALSDAVYGAYAVLRQYLGEPEDKELTECVEPPDVSKLLIRVGSMIRRYVDGESPDPATLHIAARYLMQLDRTRRTSISLVEARKSQTCPGPFSEATSKYVLYLRSFVVSERLTQVSVEPWGQVDLEDLLASQLDASHTVALGNPELNRFGPGRLVTDDDNWQDIVRVLANESRVILVIPVLTEGTCWEIDWITTNKFLGKTVFVMPPSTDQNRYWWTQNWAELREWACHMRLSFPEYKEDGAVFRVTRDGQVDTSSFSLITSSGSALNQVLLNFPRTPSTVLISDMQHGIQQQLAESDKDQRSTESGADRAERIGAYAARIAELTGEEIEPTVLTLLEGLECGDYGEFQRWAVDASDVPESPGVIALYEGPSNLFMVQPVDDLRSALEGIANGERSPVTRALWNWEVKPHLLPDQIALLNRGDFAIEQFLSFHVRSWYMYRYLTIDKATLRTQIVDLVNRGAFERGRPRAMSTS